MQAPGGCAWYRIYFWLPMWRNRLLKRREEWLACIAHKSLEICERCRLWQQNSPAAPKTTFALRATACPQSAKGRAIAKRRRNSAAFWRGDLKTLCFDSFVLKF